MVEDVFFVTFEIIYDNWEVEVFGLVITRERVWICNPVLEGWWWLIFFAFSFAIMIAFNAAFSWNACVEVSLVALLPAALPFCIHRVHKQR